MIILYYIYMYNDTYNITIEYLNEGYTILEKLEAKYHMHDVKLNVKTII